MNGYLCDAFIRSSRYEVAVWEQCGPSHHPTAEAPADSTVVLAQHGPPYHPATENAIIFTAL